MSSEFGWGLLRRTDTSGDNKIPICSMGLTIEDAVNRGWLHSKHLNSKRARKAAT